MLVACYFPRRARRAPASRTRPPEVLGAPAWTPACASCFEALGDGRTPGHFRHSLRRTRCNFDALLDKGRARRNKGTRQKPALCARIHQEWTDCDDAELELLALAFWPALQERR